MHPIQVLIRIARLEELLFHARRDACRVDELAELLSIATDVVDDARILNEEILFVASLPGLAALPQHGQAQGGTGVRYPAWRTSSPMQHAASRVDQWEAVARFRRERGGEGDEVAATILDECAAGLREALGMPKRNQQDGPVCAGSRRAVLGGFQKVTCDVCGADVDVIDVPGRFPRRLADHPAARKEQS